LSSRTYEPVEELLMSQYIDRVLPRIHTFVHLRLGQPTGFSRENPAPREERQLKLSTLKEADLVTRTLDTATIYEFSVFDPLKKLSQLLGYQDLLPATPGFEDLTAPRIQLKLIAPHPNGSTIQTALKYGIQLDPFTSPEVDQKIAARRGGR